MAPAVIIDNTPDFDIPTFTKQRPAAGRTLLLAPPSLSSQPDALNNVLEAHDRNATDIQMLDRLVMGLVALPETTYDSIILLTAVNGTSHETTELLDRQAMDKLYNSLKVGGNLVSQNGSLEQVLKTEAVLAGMTEAGIAMTRPVRTAVEQTVRLNLGKRKKADAAAVPANDVEMLAVAKRKSESQHQVQSGVVQLTPAGVGFVDTNDDYDDEDMELPSHDELLAAGTVDPATFLTEEDLKKPINIPEVCKPNGKRRRACKDCTCGLAQRIEAEDKAKRSNADAQLAKLTADDLAEVDFTVQGKVGSCGNCALGDAFRCDGCPYIGLPAFKPGEEVRLFNNDVQL